MTPKKKKKIRLDLYTWMENQVTDSCQRFVSVTEEAVLKGLLEEKRLREVEKGMQPDLAKDQALGCRGRNGGESGKARCSFDALVFFMKMVGRDVESWEQRLAECSLLLECRMLLDLGLFRARKCGCLGVES